MMMSVLRFAATVCLVGCSGATGTLFQAETTAPGDVRPDAGSPPGEDTSGGEVDAAAPGADAELTDAADAGADAHEVLDAHVMADAADAAPPPVDAGTCKPLPVGVACPLHAFASNGCGDYYNCTSTCALSPPDSSDSPDCRLDDGGLGWRYTCPSLADRPSVCSTIDSHITCCPTPKSGLPFAP